MYNKTKEKSGGKGMKSENILWELALLAFGLFMVMSAPTLSYYLIMVISGLIFIAVAIFLIVKKNKKSKK